MHGLENLTSYVMNFNMNHISKSRLELARKNAQRFISNPNVKAIIVTGSVALGHADNNSDIDTLILYDEKLNDSELNIITENAKNTGGDLYGIDANREIAVYEYIEGIRCDFGHGYIDDTERLITDMVNNPDSDMIRQLMVSGFVDSIPLYGIEWVETWKHAASHYPDGLTLLMIKEHLHFHPKWVIEKMVIGRKDSVYLYDILIQSIKDIISVLCGINKLYYNGKLKSTFFFINRMEMKPVNLLERFEHILKEGSQNSVNELYLIIEEVLSLVEIILPEYDTSRTRKIINMKLRK